MTGPPMEFVPPSSLVPWDKNPRLNEEAVPAVMESIERFGFAAPVVARREDRMLIAGHTRLEAARRLGLELVPVRWLDIPRAAAELLALADNRIAEEALWQPEALAEVVRRLAEQDPAGLRVAGFDRGEVDSLLASLEVPPAAAGKEFDVEVEDDVPCLDCPRCGLRFPK